MYGKRSEAGMLVRFWIDNFKSLVDFGFPPKNDAEDLPSLACLVGLNGAGKSTILQAFDFIAHLPGGRMDDWIKERRWKKGDLASKLGKRTTIRHELAIQSGGDILNWSGTFNLNTLRCTAESIYSEKDTYLKVHEGDLRYIAGTERISRSVQDIEYQGSVLSVPAIYLRSPSWTFR